jgi:hypothetical protein
MPTSSRRTWRSRRLRIPSGSPSRYGHLVTSAKVPALRGCMASNHRHVRERDAHRSGAQFSAVLKTGCVAAQSYSKHWTCLLPSTDLGRSTTGRLYSPIDRGPSLTHIPATSCADCSTLTGAEVTTASSRRTRCTFNRGTCSPTSPLTSCDSASNRWTDSGSVGRGVDATCSPLRARMPSPHWTPTLDLRGELSALGRARRHTT